MDDTRWKRRSLSHGRNDMKRLQAFDESCPLVRLLGVKSLAESGDLNSGSETCEM